MGASEPRGIREKMLEGGTKGGRFIGFSGFRTGLGINKYSRWLIMRPMRIHLGFLIDSFRGSRWMSLVHRVIYKSNEVHQLLL